MDLLKLDAESVTEMKAFYQEELSKAIRRIDHINKILEQLGEPSARVELRLGETSIGDSRKSKPSAKRKYKKKRGPKSKWDKVIVKSLKQADKPLTYDELTDFLMISEGRDPSKRSNTKATVQNTVFRLRKENKIQTFSLGSRIKYIAPREWFDGNEIKEDFKSKIKVPKKKEVKAKGRGPGRPPKKRGPGRPPKKRGPGRPRKTSASSSTSPKITEAKPKGSVKTPAKKKASTKKPASKASSKKAPVTTKAKRKTAAEKKVTPGKKAPAAKKASTKKKATPVKKATPKKRKILMKKVVKK